VLTADLVRARRKGETLLVRSIHARQRTGCLRVAGELNAVFKGSVGERRGDLTARCAEVAVAAADQKIADGLRKLLLDRCDFAMAEGFDPPVLRAAVFARASQARRAGAFDRDAVMAEVTEAHGLSVEALEEGLYADLKDAQRLLAYKPMEPEALLDHYQLAQEQAVFLRATRVAARLKINAPGAARALFRTLSFRRLLFTLEPDAKGWYTLTLTGPFDLFQSSKKYGLALALALPAIRACAEYQVDAEVLWGKAQEQLTFRLEGKGDGAHAAPRLSDDVEQLLTRFKALDTPWKVRRSTRILTLPGIGVSVPDLMFTHGESGAKAYLEVMGFWSRDAVWKRVELVQAGLGERILFAVSRRLRVSEAVLDGELPGELYVYKGVMSARTIAERLGP
jgi:uncharacterized protein